VSAPRFLYSEARLADQIGISREDIRPIRHTLLKEGRDWKKIGGEILLSEGSAKYLAKSFDVVSPDLAALLLMPEEPPQEVVATNGHSQRKKMRVIPPPPFNPRVVFAQDLDAQGEEGKALVWVGNNKNFCFGDEIEVEPHETQTGILQCVSEMPRDRRRPHQ
jgi:hypothetical protein